MLINVNINTLVFLWLSATPHIPSLPRFNYQSFYLFCWNRFSRNLIEFLIGKLSESSKSFRKSYFHLCIYLFFSWNRVVSQNHIPTTLKRLPHGFQKSSPASEKLDSNLMFISS